MRLCDELRKYGDSDFYPFHMPGHKRNPDFLKELYNSEGQLVDITEIDGFDNLHNASGILKEESERAARIFGSDKSYLLINGSSCGLLSAIAATVPVGKKAIVAKNCHKSVYNALKLREANAVYITPQEEAYPEYSLTLTGKIAAEDIEKAVKENPDAKAVIITSPTYEGIVSDIKAISEICHRANIPLIVDEAHGAHFRFHDVFPKSAVELGADIVVNSLHKTLPTLTSTALLHINSNLVDITQIEYYLQVFQTSSPSYVLLSSISSCLKYLENDKSKSDFDNYVNLLNEIYNNTPQILPYMDRDISKFILVPPEGMSGTDLSEHLRKDHHLELEMAMPAYALAMTSVCDTKVGFDRLSFALKNVRELKSQGSSKITQTFDKSWIGRKSPVSLVPYPPGIPLLQKGEIISEEHAKRLEDLILSGIQIEGLKALTDC